MVRIIIESGMKDSKESHDPASENNSTANNSGQQPDDNEEDADDKDDDSDNYKRHANSAHASSESSEVKAEEDISEKEKDPSGLSDTKNSLESDSKGDDIRSSTNDVSMANVGFENEEDEDDAVKDDENGNLQRVASHHSSDDDTDDSRDSEDQEQSYEEDDEDAEYQETKQRYAQICTEILSADVWSITEALMERTDLLQELWNILDQQEPLDISLASCFTKIYEHLLDKKTGDMIMFVQSQKNFVQQFIQHIENPPLMDFLLKIISSDKPDNSTGIIEFLQSQKLIPSLISFLGPDVPSSVQTSAGDFLKAFITISANSSNDNSTIGPNELSRELVSESCVNELLSMMLHGGTGLAAGVGVVIEIIRKNNSDYDFVPVMCVTMESHPPGPRDPIYLGTLVKSFAEAIPKFQEMLTREHPDRLDTSFGVIEPLGFERFKVCELIAELLHCSNMALLNDPAGEEVVRARDEERRRVKSVVARARGEMFGEDSPDQSALENDNEDRFMENGDSANSSKFESDDAMQVELDGADLKLDEKLETSQTGDGVQPTTPNAQIENDLESLNIETPKSEFGAEPDDLKMSDLDEKIKDKQSSPDSSSMSLEEYENYLRKESVVGDKLKIAFADNGCITTILNMFFEFPWNNFLHNVVFDIVQQILNAPMQRGYNKYLAIDLFGSGRLTQVICEGHTKCDEYEKKNGTRLGYMGHLTLISEEVVKFTALHAPESISPVVVTAVTEQDWINYVTHTLVQTRDQYNTILGGRRPDDRDVMTNPNAIIVGSSEGYGEGSDDLDQEGELGGEYEHDQDDENGKGSGQFVRYISEQMSGAGHFGSSDEEDEEDDDNDRKGVFRGSSQYSEFASHMKDNDDESDEVDADDFHGEDQGTQGVDDEADEAEEGEDNLELVRSHSYHDI